MALRGNLRDFSLPDVFQLVAFSRKTGVLRIARQDGESGSVWFRDGDVFFAASNWHSEPLGERMVQAQRITPQALVRALQIQQSEPEGGRRLGTILVDEGYITQAVLEVFVAEQIQDTIFDLMRWDEGEFDFDPLPDSAQQDIGLTVSMENIVMEGSRRLEEWNRIRKKIPSTDVVFKMATAPGEGSFEISLKPVEWQLLLLVDGSRSVAELAHDTNRTDFDVARIIYGLFSTGLLEFASDEEVERNRAERARREATAKPEVVPAQAAPAQAAPEAESAPVPAPVEAQPSAPFLDEPAFLGGGMPSEAHSAASLEAFIGAVLEQADAATAPTEPTIHLAPPQPVVLEPEPPLQPAIPEPVMPEPQPAPEPQLQPAPEPQPEPQPEPAPEPLPQPAPEPQPVEPQQPVVPEWEPQPPQLSQPQPLADPDLERDLLALGLGEMPPVVAEPTPQEAESLDSLLMPLQPVGSESAKEPAAEEPDFSDLLESLYLEPGQEQEVVPGPTPAPAQSEEADEPVTFADPEQDDEPITFADPEPAPFVPGPVPVTSFEDIGMDDLDFSAMSAEELPALTGASRNARPRAKVNSIPQEGAVIHRDSRVDRETLLKIIDGIRKL